MRMQFLTGFALFGALLTAATCDEGIPYDNARTDDDTVVDDDSTGVDDDIGGDDTATGITGTISVTYTMLAVLAEGQVVEPEIRIGGVRDPEWQPHIEQLESTGAVAPANIEVAIGSYFVGLRMDAAFYAPMYRVRVVQNETTVIEANISRNLTGRWELMEYEGAPPPFEEYEDAHMFHAEQLHEWLAPCPTSTWTTIQGPLCLLENDRFHSEQTDVDPLRIWDGMILDSGTRVEYTIDDDEGLRGPYRWQRLPD